MFCRFASASCEGLLRDFATRVIIGLIAQPMTKIDLTKLARRRIRLATTLLKRRGRRNLAAACLVPVACQNKEIFLVALANLYKVDLIGTHKSKFGAGRSVTAENLEIFLDRPRHHLPYQATGLDSSSRDQFLLSFLLSSLFGLNSPLNTLPKDQHLRPKYLETSSM